MCTISRNKFKRIYIKNKRLFWIFSSISEMSMKFYKIFEKKKSILA